jgi:hypothetical protein
MAEVNQSMSRMHSYGRHAAPIATVEATTFLDLPSHLIEQVCGRLREPDLLALACTSRELFRLVDEDECSWRTICRRVTLVCVAVGAVQLFCGGGLWVWCGWYSPSPTPYRQEYGVTEASSWNVPLLGLVVRPTHTLPSGARLHPTRRLASHCGSTTVAASASDAGGRTTAPSTTQSELLDFASVALLASHTGASTPAIGACSMLHPVFQQEGKPCLRQAASKNACYAIGMLCPPHTFFRACPRAPPPNMCFAFRAIHIPKGALALESPKMQ